MNNIQEQLQKLIALKKQEEEIHNQIYECNKEFSEKLNEICALICKDITIDERYHIFSNYRQYLYRDRSANNVASVEYDTELLTFNWTTVSCGETYDFSLTVPVKWFYASGEKLHKYINEFKKSERDRFEKERLEQKEREMISKLQEYNDLKQQLGR